jgi:hypothetical protein
LVIERICPVCNSKFTTNRIGGKTAKIYCSRNCFWKISDQRKIAKVTAITGKTPSVLQYEKRIKFNLCSSCGCVNDNVGFKRCKVCLQKHNVESVGYWRRLRIDAINFYGGKCICCRESILEFLAIDHIDGGGNDHRKSIRTNIYLWLKKNNYPDGFQILCHNCNMAKGFYGICPHMQIAEDLQKVIGE